MLVGKLACVSMALVTKSLNSMGRNIKIPMLFNKNINAVATLMYPFILIQSFKLFLISCVFEIHKLKNLKYPIFWNIFGDVMTVDHVIARLNASAASEVAA